MCTNSYTIPCTFAYSKPISISILNSRRQLSRFARSGVVYTLLSLPGLDSNGSLLAPGKEHSTVGIIDTELHDWIWIGYDKLKFKAGVASHVKMGAQGRVAQYRERLDKTLSSHKFSDEETLSTLVVDQTLCFLENNEKQGIALLSDRVSEFTNVIDMLRSASDNYVVPPNKTAHPSWKVKTDNKDFRVMYREGPLGSPIHTLLVEGYIDAPIDICLCVAWEATLYRTWFPELRVPTFKIIIAKCLQKVRVREQVSLVRVKVPWPLTAREVVLRYSLFEYFEDDLIIGVLNSVPDAESISFMDDEAVGAGQAVRMGFVGGFALHKVTENRSYFRTMANLDMKLDLVPPWLINFFSRQVIGGGFKLYKKSVATVSVDNMNFGKILNDPMYRRIQEGIYLRGRPDSNLGNVRAKGDAHNDPEDRNEIKADESRDESKLLGGTEDIHPSSTKHSLGDKSSALTGEETYQAENSAEDSKLTDELHDVETVDVSGFKEKVILRMRVETLRKIAIFLPVALFLVWISSSLITPRLVSTFAW